ncbi:adenylosuccinate synthetase [Bradyrhizobium sp. IC3069]|uniref:adenylosuccinate synthetase n=1 Tax=unclassified Bradyrhizobium TaxID=2631580 RepID=UPI001CD374EB|nr:MULTISPECIES: adenylosuccinate synthetase [unclassified Bradyrhizobium]MCA1365450.1 adenylosuccinate synthetase [Bradyrhizobium sp. IC4059]MCA1523151.1 adenylosuccinate synthetase [Bradyrhizobium sp. IC3069]
MEGRGMPLSVVVGGQFGSEGKGKVALHAAREKRAAFVVRVGGTNSGHTGVDGSGRIFALRQLPVSVLAPNSIAVLPPGAIIDPEIFIREVEMLGLDAGRVAVSPFASIISQEDKDNEGSSGLVSGIGSTGSGTGAALLRRVSRSKDTQLARDYEVLKPFIRSTTDLMREALNRNEWVIIEGSQGFGLSLLHGGFYPHATSRDTTAAAFVGEAGLSPIDVREIVLVIRTYPIRVAGNSGPLAGEIDWQTIARQAQLPEGYRELTTATRKVRRVGTFDAGLVRNAIAVNNPTGIVLNHFDYVDPNVHDHRVGFQGLNFLKEVEDGIGRRVDLVGTGPDVLLRREDLGGSQPTSKYSRQSER